MSQFFSSILSSCLYSSSICSGYEDHGEVEGLDEHKLSHNDQGSYDRYEVSLDTMKDVDHNRQNQMRFDASEAVNGVVDKRYLEELKSMHGDHSSSVPKGDGGARQSDSQRQTERIDQSLQSILDKNINPFYDERYKTKKEFRDRTRPTLDSKKVKPHPGDVDVPDPEFRPTGQTQPSEPAKTVRV